MERSVSHRVETLPLYVSTLFGCDPSNLGRITTASNPLGWQDWPLYLRMSGPFDLRQWGMGEPSRPLRLMRFRPLRLMRFLRLLVVLALPASPAPVALALPASPAPVAPLFPVHYLFLSVPEAECWRWLVRLVLCTRPFCCR